jgi:anaerobic ribonucleoside-triphosphate reductase
MSTKEKIGLSIFVASFGTIIDVLYQKIGGHASGGRFSHPHTWPELKENVPEFICLFFVIFAGMAIYQFAGKKTDVICPKCEESFETSDIKNSLCPKCGTQAERLKGFYERHPNLRK